MPDAKYVLLPRYIAEHLPSKMMEGGEILALDIMDGKGEPVTSRVDSLSFGSVELEGKTFNLGELLKDGKVFFATDANVHAPMLLDLKQSESY
jgi:hypothetical protein